MEINITPLFQSLQCKARFLSASVAELGADAGRITWENSKQHAQAVQVLQTREELRAFAGFARSSGFEFKREELTPDYLRALFVQWVAGDMRECGLDDPLCDWEEIEAQQSEGSMPGNIFRGDDGQVYFLAEG